MSSVPYPYMISNSPWGVYNNTYRYSTKIFADKDPLSMAFKSGIDFDPFKSAFNILSFGQKLTVTYPEGKITFTGTDYSPLFPWSLSIINSLTRADGTPVSEKQISYRELQGGQVYYHAFRREAIAKLAAWSEGKSIEILKDVAIGLGGNLSEGADFCCTLYLLPNFPLTIKIWLPDDELQGSANILFDSNANHHLHTEDIAAIGEMSARFLIEHYNFLIGKE